PAIGACADEQRKQIWRPSMSSAAPFIPKKPPLPRPRYGNLLPARGLHIEKQLAALKAKRPALFTVKPRGGGGRPVPLLSSRPGPHAPPPLRATQTTTTSSSSAQDQAAAPPTSAPQQLVNEPTTPSEGMQGSQYDAPTPDETIEA